MNEQETNWEGAGPGAGGDFEQDPVLDVKRRVLAAALPHVPFDGWSEAALTQATADAGVDPAEAKLAFPRGGVDLAMFFHREGDRELAEALSGADVGAMRIRDKVAFGVRKRLEIAGRHREAVRKGATLFALPVYAADGARAVWETADTIWTGLGDPSEDLNWYTKRAILSGVYSSTALFWLGDESPGQEQTWSFLSRRIDDVMRFEQFKAAVNANPLGRVMMMGPNWLASMVRKPGAPRPDGADPFDLPGRR